AGEVRVGDPEPGAGPCGDELAEPEDAGAAQPARHDAQRDRSRRLHAFAWHALARGQRRPGVRPDLGERGFGVRHGGPADLDAGIAPRRDATRGIAGPRAPDAQARDEGDAAVDGEQLAVVAVQPAERAGEAGRVVAADLDAGLPQTSPEPARRLPHGAEPVVDDAHGHALARLGAQGFREDGAHVVVVDDVALEVDVALGAADGREP